MTRLQNIGRSEETDPGPSEWRNGIMKAPTLGAHTRYRSSSPREGERWKTIRDKHPRHIFTGATFFAKRQLGPPLPRRTTQPPSRTSITPRSQKWFTARQWGNRRPRAICGLGRTTRGSLFLLGPCFCWGGVGRATSFTRAFLPDCHLPVYGGEDGQRGPEGNGWLSKAAQDAISLIKVMLKPSSPFF